MNIRSVGPNLLLAPSADPADGLLDLVLVSERERPRVLEYVAQRASGRDMTIDLAARRVRHVTIAAAGAEVHIDDRLERPHEKPSAMGGLVDITLLPGALQFLSA
jgi:diacylglycerol kinase (ATP)